MIVFNFNLTMHLPAGVRGARSAPWGRAQGRSRDHAVPQEEQRRDSPALRWFRWRWSLSWENLDTRRIRTSHVERQNLTIRVCVRRQTRLTNAFSKRWENLWAAYCLHFADYNFCRIHQSFESLRRWRRGSRIMYGI